MLRKLFVVTIALFGLSLAGVASAATVTADYSFVPSAPGTLEVPNTSYWDLQIPTPISNTAPITGSASITFDAVGGAPVDGGTATLDSLSFVVDMGASGYGAAGAGFGGNFSVSLVSPVSTTWTSGILQPVTATFHVSGTVTCEYVQICWFVSNETVFTTDVDTTVLLGATADLSHFDTTLPVTFDSQLLLFKGNAVLAAVPEPGTLALLGAGLAGLVAAGRWRRS